MCPSYLGVLLESSLGYPTRLARSDTDRPRRPDLAGMLLARPVLLLLAASSCSATGRPDLRRESAEEIAAASTPPPPPPSLAAGSRIRSSAIARPRLFCRTRSSVLTRTSRSLRTVRMGYAYQPVCVVYVPEAQGSWCGRRAIYCKWHRCWVYGVLTVATSPLTRPSGVAALLRMLRLPLGTSLRDLTVAPTLARRLAARPNRNPNPSSAPRCET